MADVPLNPNPLLGIAETVGAINRNKLFPLQQQQLQQELQSGQLAIQGQQIANTTNQAALQQAYMQRAQGLIAQTKDDSEVPGVLTRAAALGIIPQSVAQTILGGGVDGFDPAAVHAMRNQSILGEGNAAELKANIGDIGSVNTGQGVQATVTRASPEGVTVDRAGGSASYVPLGQSPSEMGSLVSYVGDDGAEHSIPKSAIQTAEGKGIPNVKGPDGTKITDANGAITTRLPTESLAQLNTNAQNQADRASALQTAVDGSVGRKALIDEMLRLNGDFRSGPGAAKWSGIVTEANRIFGTHFADDQASAQQVFGKISEMLAAQQRDSLGLPATNAGAEAAHLASPNTAYSPDANQEVLSQFAGNEDLLQRKAAAWAAYQQHGGTSYNKFVKQFNSVYDPRYFWEQYMTDAQKQKLHDSMGSGLNDYQTKRDRALGLKF